MLSTVQSGRNSGANCKVDSYTFMRNKRILVMGDVVTGGVLHYHTGRIVGKRLKSLLSESCYRLATLESPFSEGNKLSTEKDNILYSPCHTADRLKELGINGVSLANNHIFDASMEGFEETITILNTQGISWCGAGRSLDEARKPMFIACAGVQIGVLAYCGLNRTLSKVTHADSNRYGVAPLIINSILDDIAILKDKCQHIFVMLHWGHEYTWLIMAECQKIVDILVDSGVSAIFSSHTHRVLPYQKIRGVPVFWGLGNTLFPDFIIDPPISMTYPDASNGDVVNMLPRVSRYEYVSQRVKRVWPFLSRIGMIALVSISENSLDVRAKYVYLSKSNTELELLPLLLRFPLSLWLGFVRLFSGLKLYHQIYYKIFRMPHEDFYQ